MRNVLTLCAGFAALALPTPATADSVVATPFAWLSGCWATPSGAGREIWSPAYGEDLTPHLFGYAVTQRDGAVAFFEQMRIEPVGEAASSRFAFVVSAGGADPVRFEGAYDASQESISFENAEHDFPQRITYGRGGSGLFVTISLFDGTEPREFDFQRCEAE